MVKPIKLNFKNKIIGKISRLSYFLKAVVFGREIPLNELKGICAYLSRTHQHKIFEFLLNKYDPKIKFLKNSNSKVFYGYGCGSGNLNVYRKFIFENEILFEKIYFKHCKDFHNINWFYNNLYYVITGLGLKIPIVKRIKEGDKLCIFYYEFLKLGDPRNYEDAFNVSNLLYKNRQLLVSSHNQLEDDYVFRRGEVRLIKHLQTAGINLDRYKMFKERMFKCLPVYFQHGDLTTNCYKYNFVLDWDRSGYYPFGVDYGFIIADMLNLNIIKLSKIREFASDLVRKYHLPVNSENTIVYFGLIFWLRRSKFENKINLILIEWLGDKERFFI